MKTIVETPTLESKTSTGKAKYWIGRVVTDGTHFYLQSEAWQVGPNGKSSPLISEPSLVKSKNVGRANETTPLNQAKAELATKKKGKEDKGYHELGTSAKRTFMLPMLAHPLKDKLHTFSFPVYIQPKFDGVRCLYRTDLGPWSRQGNEFIPRVFEHLTFNTQGLTVDGELLLPGKREGLVKLEIPEGQLTKTAREFGFQQTIAAVKKYDSIVSPQLMYVIYDIAEEPKQPFSKRWERLQQLFKGDTPDQVFLCPTKIAQDPDDILEAHSAYVQQGYEGAIIRIGSGLYTPGHRSSGLLKHKDFIDAEFEIVGFKDGRGKDEGLVIWTCKTENGKEFDVRPRGTFKEREQWFKNARKYIGQKLTTRYQNLSDDGIPRFPVGIAIRDYE